jgi:hypothetical protein
MANQQAGAQGITPEQALYNYAQTQGLSNENIDTMMGLTSGATQNWLGGQQAPTGPAYPIAEGNSAGLVNPMTFDKTYMQQTPQQIAQDQEELRVKTAANQPVRAAHGGLMGLAKGGSTTNPGGTYLRGSTDGMADKLHATIDGNQPARLAHGEFVIPADVVSHLGNGNSDAGAQQLYKMMDKIRQARTGNSKQGKQINPNKFLPKG